MLKLVVCKETARLLKVNAVNHNNHLEHVDILRGQSMEFLNVKQCGTYIYYFLCKITGNGTKI